MPTSARSAALSAATSRSPRLFQRILGPDGQPLPVARIFGKHTFSPEVMEEKLPRSIYKRVEAAMREGRALDRDTADAMAHGVKEWALENGCTHFTHWFQPMTGATAEKHDAFLTFTSEGQPVERFTGDMLIQSEPDASSFPSGGTRSTFEARGYTAWDPSSPIFIMVSPNGRTLTIPSAFVSYTGEALDKKTPLLRSMEAIDRAAQKLLVSLGEQPRRVVPTLGCEQEYFLVDRAYAALRPDLTIAGRTIVGARPPKGQSMEDHYFGAIPARVQAVMQEVEQELYMLGVPAKTRHNEVAPAQFEIAPIFREANVAVDHNQVIMEVLRRVSARHDFKVVLHEKPFAGINGSGKHNNWSVSDAGGDNLLDPGTDPHENLRFLAMMASVLLAVQRHGGLLRASVATHGNDFRLGANEAPPAIMSVFLGEQLSRICDAISAGEVQAKNPAQAIIELGVAKLPKVAKDSTDRNRTSPVAFTGNKFEFRAVGSQQNPAWPMTVMNTIVADAMDQLTAWAAEAGGGQAGAFSAVRRAIIESAPIRFEGNGYSEEWREEAARRGLPNHTHTPAALEEIVTPASFDLMERYGVLSRQELQARYNVLREQYLTIASIEVDCMHLLVDEMVLPVALAERGQLAKGLLQMLDLSRYNISVDAAADRARLDRLGAAIDGLVAARSDLDVMVERASHDPQAVAELVMPALEAVRAQVDLLETIVADRHWPLPKYREMLFFA